MSLRRHDLRYGVADGVLVGHIGGDVVQTLRALGAAGQLVHGAARMTQGKGSGLADAGGAAGDDGDPALTHGTSPPQ